MTIDRMLSIFATIVSVVAVPASGYLSYRYAIKGEKRKEWNALAEPLLIILEEQLRACRKGRMSKHDRDGAAFPYDSVNSLKRRLSGKDLEKFNAKYSEYHKLKALMAGPGEKPYAAMISVIDELIPLLKLK